MKATRSPRPRARARLACLALACLALGAACAKPDEAARIAPSGAPRVVSLHDVTTELVLAVGAGDRLVGVAEPIDLSVDLPAEAKARLASVPRVGAVESLLAARPDALLGLGVIAERDPDLVAQARAAGITVTLADPETLADVYALTRLIAAAVGKAAEGEALAARMMARDAVAPSAPSARPRRVFVYDCCDPPFTAGRRAVLSDLLRQAGGENVFGALDAKWTHVGWEEVVARAPELVVVHAYTYEGQGDVTDKLAALRRVPSLERLPVVVMPLGESLGGLRSASGLERLRAAIRGLP
jgi:iron complex transport system substrate-binding protein